MNKAQLALFALYTLSALISGAGLYRFLDREGKTFMNRCVYLGETLLMGGALIVTELLLLSLLGLYKAHYLWLAVMLNYLFILDKKTREGLLSLFARKTGFNLPFLGFVLLLLVFIFRNCYFTVDVDSLLSYLFTQKVWLSHGSSLVGDATYNSTLFAPQFDTVPAALGISIPFLSQETFFPQLIHIYWRCAALLLIFGYTAYRFDALLGLAAAVFVAFNDHVFFSGVNRWVLINGAVMAFLFAAAYNFWEARRQESSFRLMLAGVFLLYALSNKIQAVYIVLFMLVAGMAVQHDLIRRIKDIALSKRWSVFIIAACLSASLWYIKNFLVTGNPFFPVLAGIFRTFGFTPEQGEVFYRVAGGISPGLFLKYMNYLFIWPGINAAKIVITVISLLPFLLFAVYVQEAKDKERLRELFFWLSISILSVMGTALACHWEPRYYRYPLAIFAFTAVIAGCFALSAFRIKRGPAAGIILLLFALFGSSNEGLKVVFDQGGYFKRPMFRENRGVLLDAIHTEQAVRKVYPELEAIMTGLRSNSDKINYTAWDIMSYNFPLFLLPVRPLVSPWHCTTVRWDSYGNEKSIIADLAVHDLQWVMQMRDKQLVFVTPEEYAREAVKLDRTPRTKYACYDLPGELCDTNR